MPHTTTKREAIKVINGADGGEMPPVDSFSETNGPQGQKPVRRLIQNRAVVYLRFCFILTGDKYMQE